MFGITTRRCSYALKAKLPGGRCLTIVGTEGIVAVARKLAIVMHRIWVDGTTFIWSRETAAPA